MAPRANWKGYLELSLGSCAVALCPATKTRDRVRFNRETGNRVHYEVVDADTGEEVPQEDRVKGYQVDRDWTSRSRWSAVARSPRSPKARSARASGVRTGARRTT